MPDEPIPHTCELCDSDFRVLKLRNGGYLCVFCRDELAMGLGPKDVVGLSMMDKPQ